MQKFDHKIYNMLLSSWLSAHVSINNMSIKLNLIWIFKIEDLYINVTKQPAKVEIETP